METKQILKDIGKRCQGDIYLGIVGPVRRDVYKRQAQWCQRNKE